MKVDRRWRGYNNSPPTEKKPVIYNVPSCLKIHIGRGNEGQSWGGRQKIRKRMKNKRGSEYRVFLRINLLNTKKSSNFDWGLDSLPFNMNEYTFIRPWSGICSLHVACLFSCNGWAHIYFNSFQMSINHETQIHGKHWDRNTNF